MDLLDDVPRVDLDDLVSDDPARRDRAAEALGRGFGELGLVAVAGHDVPPELVDAVHDGFWTATCAPEDHKTTWHHPDLWCQRGWTPPNTERAVVADGAPDFKECWFAAPLPLDPVAAEAWPQLYAENHWPDPAWCAAGWPEAVVDLGARLHAVGTALLRGCARQLGLDEGTFDAVMEGGAHVTRTLRYLPLDDDQVDAGVLWGEEHTDFNLLTVLGGGRFVDALGRAIPRPDEQTGLSLRTRATPEHPRGRQLPGTPPPGHLVSQVGQQLEILTGGRFQATPHVIRAPRTPGIGRLSIAHFLHVHGMHTLAPLPELRTPQAMAAYGPPVLAGTYGIKTLVDIGLAPPEALQGLGYRHYGRLAGYRAAEN